MRLSTSAARDVSRLCAQCRLHTRRASSLASTTRSRPLRPSTSQAPALRSTPLFKSQTALFSHSARRQSASTDQPEATSDTSSPSSPPQTFYDLFPTSLPPRPPPTGPFHIDTRALRREFLHLQSLYHPDKHPPSSKPRAEATSAHINEAHKTLANPLLRAQYLLSLRGVDVANDETLKVQDEALLMLVLETREEIEEAGSEKELVGLREVNEERIGASEEVLDKAFGRDDVQAAKEEAVKLRYWVNIRDSLDNWEPGKPVTLEH